MKKKEKVDSTEKEILDPEEGTLSSTIVSLISKDVSEFIQDEYGSPHIVLIDSKGKNRLYRIKSKQFGDYVSYVAWKKMERAISPGVKSNVIATFEAKAMFEGGKVNLHLRTAFTDKALWYDLGGGRVVKITSAGWEVKENEGIYFRSFNHQKIQVDPDPKGDFECLFKYLRFEKQKEKIYKTLIKAYIVSSLIPDIPRPILTVHGQAGSAKSTLCKIIKKLVDPSWVEILTYPKNPKDFIQILSHHFFAFFDNLSYLTTDQSDQLCRVCTGDGFIKRTLYTDDEDTLYHYKRLVGLNGVTLVGSKPDLLDRCLIIELEPISDKDRIHEDKFWKDFEIDQSKILGGMFSLLSEAMLLLEEDKIELKEKPRLADFAFWGAAITVASGGTTEEFVEAYKANINSQTEEAVENNSLAQTIISYMDGQDCVTESAKDLFNILFFKAQDLGLVPSPTFPKSVETLWKKIKVIKSVLIKRGITCSYNQNDRPRTITIANVGLIQEVLSETQETETVSKEEEKKESKSDGEKPIWWRSGPGIDKKS